MLDAAQMANFARSDEKYEQLAVDSRVLRAGQRTMAIANISHLQIEQPGRAGAKRGLLLILGGLLALAGLGQLAGGGAGPGLMLLLVAGGLIYWALSLKDLFALTIASNDGSRTMFTGTNRALLIEAMEFITAKIDRADQTSRTTFNFNNSTIVGSQMGDVIRN
ncbi:MAG: DUF6232 family protein [Siculibacillus sp.]|nr:DUF6232 family protein [Siculibacillus sp.]